MPKNFPFISCISLGIKIAQDNGLAKWDKETPITMHKIGVFMNVVFTLSKQKLMWVLC